MTKKDRGKKDPAQKRDLSGEKKIETTIENCPKSTIANYKRLQI